jgi:hypothetical protein
VRHRVAAILALLVAACASHDTSTRPTAPAPSTTRLSVDDTFARVALAGGDHRALLTSGALAAVQRHRSLTGAPAKSAGAVLEELLGKIKERAAAARVLRHWRGRHAELVRCAAAARRHLPTDVGLEGTIFLAAGYDIGVVSPPDVVLNVAHPHFTAAPAELCHYVTHEVHHLGFLAVRPMPDLRRAVRTRDGVLALIRYTTQLEGMAVHAAYAPRQAAGALAADADYRVYRDPRHARDVRRAYAARIRQVQAGAFSAQLVGEVLTALSSGERLWYRYGALVAREIEARGGREALVRTIRDPGAFDRVADELMP